MTALAGRYKILLVEDEAFVRDVASEILAEEGYDVLSARTGAEAISLFKQSGPVHLLVTDMVMPGMNGRDLADKLASLCPGVKTLYMSGYNEDFGDHPAPLTDKDLPFLQKPFTAESLSTKVKEVLALLETK